MPKIAKQLSKLEVDKLSSTGRHAIGGVAGLYLEIKPSGSKSWILSIKIADKRRYIGLGSHQSVTLKEAREKAQEYRKLVENGVDPILEKNKLSLELSAKQKKALIFKMCAEKYIAIKSYEWRNLKHQKQWRSTLQTYAYPVIGHLYVADITTDHVLQILEPIWISKTETATRIRERIECVLGYAIANGYRDSTNPAIWKGLLSTRLPAPSKIKTVKHHQSLPYQETPAFIQILKQKDSITAKALLFAILTAARSGEIRGAIWNEINFFNQTWTIPKEKMKANREHTVALSSQAIELLKTIIPSSNSPLIFPSPNDKQLSDMAMNQLLRRLQIPAVPHGFRSTFRVWCAEQTDYPREMAEFALAHTIESKTEAAYLRTNMLGKRRMMMQDWANFLYSHNIDNNLLLP